MFTSRKAGRAGIVFHFGMDWPDCNNRQLTLNIMTGYRGPCSGF